MAAGVFNLYKASVDRVSINDLLSATVKFALVASTYTFDEAHDEWADVSANEIAAGFGYTAGGAALASKVATSVTNGYKFASANVSWTASGGSIPAWRHAVMYVSGSLWGRTDPLIGAFLGDSTPADIPSTPDGAPLVLVTPGNGWFDAINA